MENELELLSTNAKCETCGSNIVFDPKSQNLKCPQCSNEYQFEKSREQVKHLINEVNEDKNSHDSWAAEMKVVKCQTCGAKITISGLSMTSCCPYCGSDYVVEEKQLVGLKPDVVLPFAFDEEDASIRFAKGIKKKFFAPRALKKRLPKNKIHGIYVPAFTFDADTSSSYKGVLKKVTSRTDSKGRTHTDVKYINISGTQDMVHRDYVVETSSKITEKEINSLLPFNLNESYKYTNNFIRGYAVEHYEDSLEKCYKDAQKGMEARIKKTILSKYDYTSVESFNCYTTYFNALFSYRLMPIYCFEFLWKDKKYITYMNGQSGKIGIGYPKSKLKQFMVGFVIFIVLVAIAILFIWLGMDSE